MISVTWDHMTEDADRGRFAGDNFGETKAGHGAEGDASHAFCLNAIDNRGQRVIEVTDCRMRG